MSPFQQSYWIKAQPKEIILIQVIMSETTLYANKAHSEILGFRTSAD